MNDYIARPRNVNNNRHRDASSFHPLQPDKLYEHDDEENTRNAHERSRESQKARKTVIGGDDAAIIFRPLEVAEESRNYLMSKYW